MPPAKKTPSVKVDYDVILHDLDKLVPNPRNANDHSAEQVGQIAGAMLTFGWTDPIIVWKEGLIIAGHGRRLAAMSLNLKQVPCIDCSHMSENEARAFALAHNRITRNSDPNLEMMGIELRELANSDWSLTDLGFSQREIDDALSGLEEPISPDDFASVDDETIETNHECPKCGYRWSSALPPQ